MQSNKKTRTIFATILGLFLLSHGTGTATAQNSDSLPGTQTLNTSHSYQDLIKRFDRAVKKNKMGLVTRASATLGAKRVLKKTIPGNMVIGIYHPRFAVRMLEASIPAGIEAPLRFYITENADKTANLTYRKPTSVFAPYGSAKLDAMAKELDGIFAAIARDATAR
ncbi:MAG: DUF302 domain-containing protein [Rhodospirillaceae bacterium]|jgi:uncharacterized protein (DUF302 family)|nr:DUF302 domain-containing protein [Rhodospirillaceae bacterium]MBT5047379.1 DUF302 domain-containing protein [Rhodospirillaceae bacterium]MBT5455905.1 DUF302 domain-containing protein [Rhodospirillaceae bacterium]